jgi:hypothetical protein
MGTAGESDRPLPRIRPPPSDLPEAMAWSFGEGSALLRHRSRWGHRATVVCVHDAAITDQEPPLVGDGVA